MHAWCKFCDSSPNWGQLSCRQAKFPKILSQNGQNDLEGHSQWPPFSIPAESTPGCMFDANLVLLAQICDELQCLKLSKKSFRFSCHESQVINKNCRKIKKKFPVLIQSCRPRTCGPVGISNTDELSHGHAKFPTILSQNGHNDLEGQG